MKDHGIVLQKRRSKEKDEVVILLTKNHGKKTFMSYGSRDSKSKKSGALQLSNTIEFQAKMHGSFPVLQQVRALSSRAYLFAEKRDLDLFYRMSELLKFTDEVLKEDQSSENIFDLLHFALDQWKIPIAPFVYSIRVLFDLGFLPDWKKCISCSKKFLEHDQVTPYPENKGFAHGSCFQEKVGKEEKVDFSLLKALSFFQQHSFSKAMQVELSSDQVSVIKKWLHEIALY